MRRNDRSSFARTARFAPRAFTLVELLIIIGLLGIMAAMVVPLFGATSETARTEALAANVGHVRRTIALHSGRGDTPLGPAGFPLSIDIAWFRAGALPDHAWTGRPMVLEVVTAGKDVIYPADKIFDPTVPASKDVWYNASNGVFCARVPERTSGPKTLDLFNAVNKVNAGTLDQTDE